MSGLHRSERTPSCPACGWHLRFAAVERAWQAACWNPSCDVTEVPAHLHPELVAFVRDHDEVRSLDVARAFRWKLPNANMHLVKLMRAGVLKRRAVDAERGNDLSSPKQRAHL